MCSTNFEEPNTMKREVFKNENCFIIGATGGIGRSIAMKMAENKCNLFFASTNNTKLKNLKEEIITIYGEKSFP